MSRQEKAEAKRARRAARNERHPGAFSAVAEQRPTPAPGRWWTPGRFVPAIANREEAEARLAVESRAGGRMKGRRGFLARLKALIAGTRGTDVDHHRGGAR